MFHAIKTPALGQNAFGSHSKTRRKHTGGGRGTHLGVADEVACIVAGGAME